MLTDDQKDTLLQIARESVEAAIKGEKPPQHDIEDEALQREQGAFVTLNTDGNLRGCLGRFTSDMPLWQTVQQMAADAATRDPRFTGQRITLAELPELEIEISVLSPLEKTDDPLELELGTHGIYIKRGGSTGCFLPQVATETGWSKEQFLQNCCAGKAGLSPSAWKDKDTEVYLFTAEVFGE